MPVPEDVKTSARTKPAEPAPPASAYCLQCGARELRTRRATFFQRLFSLVSRECGRCDYRQTGLKFSFLTILTPLVLGLLVYGGYRLSGSLLHPDDSASGNADALARARSSSGALTTFEQLMLKKPRATLDNAAILKLVKAGVSTNIITQMVRNSNADYDISPAAIIELTNEKVDPGIILAMQEATYK